MKGHMFDHNFEPSSLLTLYADGTWVQRYGGRSGADYGSWEDREGLLVAKSDKSSLWIPAEPEIQAAYDKWKRSVELAVAEVIVS